MVLEMKIAIVTIQSINYGNRLQNYALSQVLSKYGMCKTFYTKREETSLMRRAKRFLLCMRNKTKFDSFMRFNRNIPYSNYIYGSKQSQKVVNSKFDYFVAGSDQIWNPNFDFISGREFLEFSDKEKNIAYAASIGVDKLTAEELEIYRKRMMNFKLISMREDAGAELVEAMIGRKPLVVLDPTMLLSREEWIRVANPSVYQPQEDYIFKYILGVNCVETNAAIEVFAKKNKLKIFELKDIESDDQRAIGPSEFISLLMNSQMVFTDSFHGTVFSILFHKPFINLMRNKQAGYGNMNSRLVTLLNLFELQDRLIKSVNDIDVVVKKIDYDKIDAILKKKRVEAFGFLEKALGVTTKEQ